MLLSNSDPWYHRRMEPVCLLTSQFLIMRTFPRCIKSITIQELRQHTPLWTFCICQILGERSSQHLHSSGWAETAVQAPLLWHSRVHCGEAPCGTPIQQEDSGGFTPVPHHFAVIVIIYNMKAVILSKQIHAVNDSHGYNVSQSIYLYYSLHYKTMEWNKLEL